MAGNGKKSCCSRKGGGSLYGGKSRNASGGKRRSLRRSVLRKTVRRGGKSRRLSGGRKRRSRRRRTVRRTVRRGGKTRRASGRRRRTVKRGGMKRSASEAGLPANPRNTVKIYRTISAPGAPGYDRDKINSEIKEAMKQYMNALVDKKKRKQNYNPAVQAAMAAMGAAGITYTLMHTDYELLFSGVQNIVGGVCQLATGVGQATWAVPNSAINMAANLAKALSNARFILGLAAATAYFERNTIQKILKNQKVKEMFPDPSEDKKKLEQILTVLNSAVKNQGRRLAGGTQYDNVKTLLEIIGDEVYKQNPERGIELYSNIIDSFNKKCGKIPHLDPIPGTKDSLEAVTAQIRAELEGMPKQLPPWPGIPGAPAGPGGAAGAPAPGFGGAGVGGFGGAAPAAGSGGAAGGGV